MSVNVVVENREERLDSIIAYGGVSTEILEKFKQKCLKNADRSFTQAFQCQQMTSILTLITVKDAVMVIHAPVGCTGCASFMNSAFRRGQTLRGIKNPINAKWVATDLDESDVIHGGEEKLREAILEIERRHKPKIIFVLTSCASGIIGDDVEGVIAKVSQEVDAKVLPVNCEGFKTKITATGYDACYSAILNYILDKEPKPKDPNLVNVLSPFSINKKDHIELERLLSAIGIKANFVPAYAGLEDIEKITSAAATTTVCHVHGEYFMDVLEKKYGIPYTREVMPLGIESTDKWLLEVAGLVGKTKEAKELIKREHERIQPEIDYLKSQLKGKRAFISGGPARATTAGTLAQELGIELVGLHLYHFDELVGEEIKRLVESYGSFNVSVANMQPFEQANLIQRLKPDLFIGVGTWIAKQGITSASVLDQLRNSLGYEGALVVGRKLADAVKNPSFGEKLAKWRKLPYKQEWFDENPFKYLKLEEVV
jgi:nitrogenase molybdenum-iron protein alpha chain